MKAFLKERSIKIELYIMLMITLFLLPQFAMAQYKWVLNGITSLRAGASYFSSDALQESSRAAHHNAIGWNGQTPIDIEFCIRNYENTLLYNEVGQTVKYQITFTCNTYTAHGEGSDRTETLDETSRCEATLYERDGTVLTAADGNTFTITATEEEIAQQRDYVIKLSPKSENGQLVEMNVHDRAEVVVYAQRITDNSSHEFAGALTRIYSYEVTDGNSYIAEFYLACSSGNTSRFWLQLGTSDVPNLDGHAENIVLWWDTDAIGTTMVNNYAFSDRLMDGSGDYVAEYTTREVDGITHSYSMLRLRDIGSDAIRTVYYDLKLDKGDKTLENYLNDNADTMIARGSDPKLGNTDRDPTMATELTDEIIRSGAVIGYYIEGQKPES